MKGREGRRKGGRKGGGEGGGIRSPPQHSTAQRSNTAAENVNSRAWSWENIPGRALLLGSGGRPKAARGQGLGGVSPAAPSPSGGAGGFSAWCPRASARGVCLRHPGHIHISQSGSEFIVLAFGALPWHRGYPGISAKLNPYAFLSMLKKKKGTYFWISKKLHVTLGRL